MKVLLSVGLSVVITAQAAAQGRDFGLSGQTMTFLAREGLRDSRQHGQGTLVGGEGRVQLGKASLTIRGLFGDLSADSTGDQAHSLRTAQVSLEIHPANWLATGPRIEVQRTHKGQEVTTWRLYGASTAIAAGVGVEGLIGRLEGAWYPIQRSYSTSPYVARLRNGSSMEVALGYAPLRGRVRVWGAYRVEAYNFDQIESVSRRGSIRRAGLMVSLGVRLS